VSVFVVCSHIVLPARGPGLTGIAARRGTTTDLALRIEALTRAMSARDALLHEHAQRVQRYAVALAGETGIADHPLLEALDAAALLHDIGKLGIPDRLLQKPGPLTQDEYDHVKQHVIIGADILAAMASPGALALTVRHHHENWDGTGYPDRLRGAAIPIAARVLAVVDCFDALTSDRPYRRAMSHDSAAAMIQKRLGTMFDPEIAAAFLGIVQRLHSASACGRAGQTQAPALAHATCRLEGTAL
jgi:putative nucleotidyltransferase with HDIG domain